MTTNKHTAGPWKACRSNEDFTGTLFDREADEKPLPYTRIESATGTIAAAHDLFEFSEANARLIAAAPELLEALQKILYAHDMQDNGAANLCPAYASMARAVIAKAKGEV